MNPADANRDIPLPKIQMAFACEGITTDPFQRVSLINIIDELAAAAFPTATAQLFSVFGFEASIPQILGQVKLTITGPDSAVVQEIAMPDIALTEDRYKARVIHGLMGQQWNQPGQYTFKLTTRNRELASFSIMVTHQQAQRKPGV